ncbi:unnamed protein product [Rotaria sordida]|uniref:MULE transposase domain-containing protein n=1 Tax=Rotaria sordida TaxID=392033 RepID=A0A815UG73_9BILA|nr:unnamed protein product [Rotaria sordida]
MSTLNWSLLNIVHSLDEVKVVAKSNGATVPDDDPNSITVMFRNTHNHKYRAETTRLPSPVRQSVSKYVHIGLTESQICSSLLLDHPSLSVPSTKLTSLVKTERRKNRPKIFSVFDFCQWCNDHQDGAVPHSTFVPFYFINDIDDLFVLFTTKELIRQIQYSPLLQIDATYKLTWNELPLGVFGTPDCNRNFRPFGVAPVSEDESSSCYEHLFNSLRSLSIQQFHQPYLPKFIMADGALGITSAQQKIFPNVTRLMCWFHMMQKCHSHRNLLSKQQWSQVDKEIHAVQLSFSDDVFNHGINLLMNKWRTEPSLANFCDYFNEQWVEKLRYWYEGSALNLPSTNNGCESFNATIKRQYTL